MSMQQIFYVLGLIILTLLILGVIFYRLRKVRAKRLHPQAVSDLNLKQIYIGNLSYQISEQNLKEYFSQFGSVNQVRVVKNRSSGRSKGFGFVTYDHAESAKKALAAHGRRYQGRAIVVRIAKPR